MEDASLEDFLGDDGEDNAGADPDGATDAPDGEGGAVGGSTGAGDGEAGDADGERSPVPDPDRPAVESTYRWDPAGGRCAVCGGSADVRWRDEAGLVCAECKDW